MLPNFITFHERNTHPVYPNGFLPYEESEIDDQSVAVGWRSPMGPWDVDVSVNYGKNTFDFSVSDSINASIGAQYLADNPGASIAQIVANAGPTAGHSGSIEFDQLTFNVDVRRAFEGMLSALAAGLERRSENYEQVAGDTAAWSCGLPHRQDFGAFAVGPDGMPIDGTVAACGFQGYPGYGPRNAMLSVGDRDSIAGYLDLESAPTDALSLGAAIRAENYSDAGGQATGKLTARIEVSDTLALRGAMSTGFRAPSLSQRRFNSILFVGSEQGLTTTFSANEGHPISRAFGVDALEHETSRNVSAGVVLRSPDDRARLSVDFYRTQVDDRVVRSQGLGCAGIAACDALQVATAAFFFNGVDTSTQGFDVAARWGTAFAGGYLWLAANGHVNETEITGRNLPARAPAGLGFGDYYGGWGAAVLERGQPQSQANVAADWQRGDLGCALAREPLRRHRAASARHWRDRGGRVTDRGPGSPVRGAQLPGRAGHQQSVRRTADGAAEDTLVERAVGHPLSHRYAVRFGRTFRLLPSELRDRPVGRPPSPATGARSGTLAL